MHFWVIFSLKKTPLYLGKKLLNTKDDVWKKPVRSELNRNELTRILQDEHLSGIAWGTFFSNFGSYCSKFVFL